MKIKVSEATNLQLDRLVAKCEDITEMFWTTDEGGFDNYAPSTDYAQGGPIMEGLNITGLRKTRHLVTRLTQWHCFIDNSHFSVGPTALIAVMRCYVASTLGDEVDVPEELK